MAEYFKVWLKKKNHKKIKSYYVKEEGSPAITQLLFDKLPFGVQISLCDKINEKQFERIIKSTRLGYRNIEEALNEGVYSTV